MEKTPITFDEGWTLAMPAIQKFLDRVEDLSKAIDSDKNIVCPKVPQEEFAQVYNTIFEMCNQKDPCNLSGEIWDAYEKLLKSYFESHSVTDLNEAQKRGLPKVFLKAWSWR